MSIATYKDLGFTSYDAYIASHHFVRLRKMVGVGKKKCQRCHKRLVALPHHLHYLSLGRECKKDVKGVCFPCNNLCHFDDDGKRIPVTTEGIELTARWREINSLWWRFKQLRPSDVLETLVGMR